MATGIVKWFNSTKGYGFIQPQGGGKDVFVHISAVERAGLSTLNEGQQVQYEEVANKGKTSAESLQGEVNRMWDERVKQRLSPNVRPKRTRCEDRWHCRCGEPSPWETRPGRHPGWTLKANERVAGQTASGSARLTPPEVDNFSMGLGQEAAHEIDGEAQEPRRIGAGSGTIATVHLLRRTCFTAGAIAGRSTSRLAVR